MPPLCYFGGAFCPHFVILGALSAPTFILTSIRFCLDRDEPGRKAAAELMRKYYELGYEVEDCPPPAGYKDYNEWLVAAKLNLNQMNQRADEPVRA